MQLQYLYIKQVVDAMLHYCQQHPTNTSYSEHYSNYAALSQNILQFIFQEIPTGNKSSFIRKTIE